MSEEKEPVRRRLPDQDPEAIRAALQRELGIDVLGAQGKQQSGVSNRPVVRGVRTNPFLKSGR